MKNDKMAEKKLTKKNLSENDRLQGRKMAAYRKATGKTQEEIAKESGYSVRQWLRMENGEWPEKARAREQAEERVAATLGVPVSDLRGRNGESIDAAKPEGGYPTAFLKADPGFVQWNPLLDPFSSQVSHSKYSLEAQQTARYWRAVIFQPTESEQQQKFARWKRLLFDLVDAAMEHLEGPILAEEVKIISRNQSLEAVARMLDNLRKREQRKISHPVNVAEEVSKGLPG